MALTSEAQSISITQSIGARAKSFLRNYLRNRGAIVGLAIIVMFSLFSLFPQIFTSISPTQPNFSAILKAPSSAHYFGTDNLGRDVFARIVWGARVSLEVGFLSGILMLLIGLVIGVAGGYFGGKLDKLVTTITDFTLMIPIIPLILVIA
ncbi:MAG: ABC transporter permease, partial [Thaumarchaeota archaeon]|nr:ABC transporter permease [Nitrososphaerota archaeon]